MQLMTLLTKWLEEDDRLLESDIDEIRGCEDLFVAMAEQRRAEPKRSRYTDEWIFDFIERGEWWLDFLKKENYWKTCIDKMIPIMKAEIPNVHEATLRQIATRLYNLVRKEI